LRISIDAKAKVNIGEFSERMENPEKKNQKRETF